MLWRKATGTLTTSADEPPNNGPPVLRLAPHYCTWTAPSADRPMPGPLGGQTRICSVQVCIPRPLSSQPPLHARQRPHFSPPHLPPRHLCPPKTALLLCRSLPFTSPHPLLSLLRGQCYLPPTPPHTR